MGFLKKLLTITGTSDSSLSSRKNSEKTSDSLDLNQRLQNLRGQENISQQLLYEKWAVKSDWLLKHEALPLLYCIDPENNISVARTEQKNNIDQLWYHAKKCVEQGLLTIIDKEQPEDNWRVNPLDLYRWARISRIEIPDTFSTLMEFISQSIKQPALNNSIQDNQSDKYSPVHFDENRERVLGTALALLAAYPEKCKNSRGQIKVDKIVNLINEKGAFWLGDKPLDLSPTAIRDLINKWLNTLPSSDTNV